jgi:hypothetical protein
MNVYSYQYPCSTYNTNFVIKKYLLKITKILFYLRLKSYLQNNYIKKKLKKLLYYNIKSYYNSYLRGLSLSYILKTEEYIKILIQGYSSKSTIYNLFLKN